MRAAHQPESYGLVLGPREMDAMVEVFRMFKRDFEVTELHEQMLDELEAVYVGERAGGRSIDMNYLFGELPAGEQDDEDGGGGAVSS